AEWGGGQWRDWQRGVEDRVEAIGGINRERWRAMSRGQWRDWQLEVNRSQWMDW
ncbi:unnamed protein product, partial [Staurois parvus]